MNPPHMETEHQPPHPSREVEITFDDNPVSIAEGTYKVSQLKELFNVPAEYVLNEVVDGVLKALPNERSVHIKGGEVFVSQVPQGGSS